ncbi:Ohr subfamily peroxiredoxin [Saccharopolyspora lacisalsi]|uniref:Ohr subfamily peroxiredoxin n=1 Tax=Halosaccharopolyspora lacisalsi TaxID=1000566 RepID=A0A839DUC9_9PSEU|nr:Ohr subfamily peroxiredoxin [Halosaccharopolyspora lacisalsi]
MLDLDLAVPKELGGPGGAATSSEQLFATGYSACFHSALQLVARRPKVDISGSSVTTGVSIGPDAHGGYGLNVSMTVSLPGLGHEQAQQLVEQADRTCPYSNAVRGNVDIDLQVA